MFKLNKFCVIASLVLVGLSFTSSVVFAQEASEITQTTNPLTSEFAYRAIVKIYTYIDDREFFLFPNSFGSGIIIDPRGIILTNYHVVGDVDNPRPEAYRICLTYSMEREPFCDYVAKLIAADVQNDVALLRFIPQSDFSNENTFPYLPLDYTSAAIIGDSVRALGYPDIGGQTITVSQGKIIGKETMSDRAWLKTDAVVSLGSSGGALLNDQGKVIGLTTALKSDLNALGYVMDMYQFQYWIDGSTEHRIKGNRNNEGNVVNVHTLRLISLMKEQATLNTSENIKIDLDGLKLTLTRPKDWEDYHTYEYSYSFFDPKDMNGGTVGISFFRSPYKLKKQSLVAFFKAETPLLKIKKSKKVMLNGTPAYLMSLLNKNVISKNYYIPTEKYIIKIGFSNGNKDKDKKTVTQIIRSIRVDERSANRIHPKALGGRLFYLNLLLHKDQSDWFPVEYNSNEQPIQLYNSKYPNAVFKIKVIDLNTWPDAKNASNKALLKKITELYKTINNTASLIGITADITESVTDYKIQDQSYIHLKVKESINEKVADYLSYYAIRRGEFLLTISLESFSGSKTTFMAADKALVKMIEDSLKLET